MLSTQTSESRKPSDYLATYGLWLGTVVLAIYEISLVREIILSIYAWFLVITDRTAQVRADFQAAALGQGVTIVMAILAIAIIIGGFEYHHRRVGDPKALKVLLWTLGVQVVILAIGLLI